MLKELNIILEIQEFDMKMIRLMRLKRDRQKELDHLKAIRSDLKRQCLVKEGEIIELKKNIRVNEGELEDTRNNLKKLEAQQNAVKKLEEFTAMTREITSMERERLTKEQRLSDLYEKLTAEEEAMKHLQETYDSSETNSKSLEKEVLDGIERINEEGKQLKAERDGLVTTANPDVFRIYERLLRNKRDRVVVPVENRCCTGCHITLTAQHENLVRKGERLVFCEHCSRIHYWPGGAAVQEEAPRRRRRTVAA